MTQNFVACRLACNFADPEKFIPERWLKGSSQCNKGAVNPYLVLPFGHGMRACIARRFAEQNMLILMLRVSNSKNSNQRIYFNIFLLSLSFYSSFVNLKSAGPVPMKWISKRLRPSINLTNQLKLLLKNDRSERKKYNHFLTPLKIFQIG